MNQQPVLCPWCGSEMTPVVFSVQDEGWMMCYRCPSCGAATPNVVGTSTFEDTTEEAYQRAMQKLFGKPMTWEEIKSWPHDWIFVEFHLGDVFAMMPYINPSKPQHLDVYTFDNEGYETYGPYGDGFRCWDHYPTEEERRAAPWKT